ncbi:MAG: DUF4474 domain-containing protein [Clostridiales bacterium]|nr:DUF4474 domain-containing protein [Clostridiales bacterium]
MKKLFRLTALVLALVSLFCACGKNDVSGTTDKTTDGSTKAPVEVAGTTAPVTTVPDEPTTAQQPSDDSTAASRQPSGDSNTPPSNKPVSDSTATTAASRTTTVPTTSAGGDAYNDRSAAEKVLNLAGFAYDAENDLFYSVLYPLQRHFGFNIIYDIAAPRTGMIYSTERIYFDYGGKNWMCQLWKGQYGITVGAEIGMYYKPESRKIAHYDCVGDEDLVMMKMDVYKDGKFYFSRGPEKHWWLTGFKLLNVAIPLELQLKCVISWDDTALADAFEIGLHKGLKNAIITPYTFRRTGNDFYITW